MLQVFQTLVFQFAFEFVEPEFVCKGRIEIGRFGGSFSSLLVVVRKLCDAHQCHASCDEQKNDAHVARLTDEQVAEVVGAHGFRFGFDGFHFQESLQHGCHLLSEEFSNQVTLFRHLHRGEQHSGEQDVSAESNFFRRQLHCFQRKNEAVESGVVAQQRRICGEGALHVVRQQTSLLFGQTRLTVSPKRQQGGKERMAFRLLLFDVISLYHSLFVCGFLLFQPMVNQFSGETDLSGDGG